MPVNQTASMWHNGEPTKNSEPRENTGTLRPEDVSIVTQATRKVEKQRDLDLLQKDAIGEPMKPLKVPQSLTVKKGANVFSERKNLSCSSTV